MKRLELELFRRRKQLTQKQMADKLGISASLYCGIENGKREPAFGLVEKFGEVFKNQYDDILVLFKKEE